jgi:hypothetical protein
VGVGVIGVVGGGGGFRDRVLLLVGVPQLDGVCSVQSRDRCPVERTPFEWISMKKIMSGPKGCC